MKDATSSPELPPTAPNEPLGAVLPWVMFICFAFVISYLTRSIFGPLLPGIETELGISHAASTRLLFYSSAGYTASMLFSGPACARIRPRLLMAASLVFGGLLFQLIAITENYLVLSVLFFVFGLATGQYFNASMSALRGLVRPSQWSKTVSINEIGPNIAFIVGPVMAEFGSAWLGWRGTVVCLGWGSVAFGLAVYFFAKGGDEPVGGSVSLKRMAASVRHKELWLFTWFMGLAIAGQFAPFSVMTLHMTEERAIAPDMAALLLSVSRIAMPAGALLGGYLSIRFGTRRTVRACSAVYAFALLCMGTPLFPLFLLGLFLQPLFTAMLFPALYTMLAETFPSRRQPLLIGLGVPIASFFGIGIMPGILGIFGDHLGFAAGFLAMGVIVAASLLLFFVFPGSKRDETVAER